MTRTPYLFLLLICFTLAMCSKPSSKSHQSDSNTVAPNNTSLDQLKNQYSSFRYNSDSTAILFYNSGQQPLDFILVNLTLGSIVAQDKVANGVCNWQDTNTVRITQSSGVVDVDSDGLKSYYIDIKNGAISKSLNKE